MVLLILKAQNPVHLSNQLNSEENEKCPHPVQAVGVAPWSQNFSSMYEKPGFDTQHQKKITPPQTLLFK